MRGSVPATGMELRPWGLICPDTSNWGDWDQGTATGQTKCLSPDAGWTHLVHIQVFAPSELILLSQGGEEDEIIGAVGVHASALCVCL